MRVGSVVYATDSGLGILAKSFYDHGIVTDVVVIRHGRHETHDWYPGAQQVTNLKSPEQQGMLRDFCAGMDAMLFFETPFTWSLIGHCRTLGVKTALMPMMECMPQRLPAEPDLMVCPSLLDLQYYPHLARCPYCGLMALPGKMTCECGQPTRGIHSTYLPVPVDVPWRLRERAEVFVHNAGHGGLKGRNGIKEVLDAMPFVKSPIKLIIRCQDRLGTSIEGYPKLGNVRVDYRSGTADYSTLWDDGDVFVFPEAFDGLSLPLQEARAAGMLVMCGDRFPMNTWLPREPLIPVASYRKERIGPPYNEYSRAVFDPRTIAATIDSWYSKDVSTYSEMGRSWALANSWERLGPVYQELLQNLVEGKP